MRYDSPSTLPLELAVVEICSDDLSPASPTAPRSTSQQTTQQATTGRVTATSAPAPAYVRTDRRNAPTNAPAADPPERPPERPHTAPATQPPGTNVSFTPMENPSAPATPLSGDNNDLRDRWASALRALGRCKGKKYNLGALLRDCKIDTISLDGETLVLPFAHRANWERMQEEMEEPGGQRMVSEAVVKFFGPSYEFRLTLTGNNGDRDKTNFRPIQQSPLVRTALGMGARILEEYSE